MAVPCKQLYLPFAALDLRESFAPNHKTDKTTLGACAQQLVLLGCAGRWQGNLSAQAWVDQLGVSKKTVSRAYKEVLTLGLAQQGMLAAPKQRSVAIAWADWTGIKKLTGMRELAHEVGESVQVQLWRYDPGFMYLDKLSQNYHNELAVVDPLSLYLILHTDADDRIEITLEDLLDRFWSDQVRC